MRTFQESLRIILNQVNRDRLLVFSDRLHIPVTDRRAKVAIIDALITAAPSQLKALLDNLARVELNAACKKLGVDHTGVHNGPIVRRLLDHLNAAQATGKPSEQGIDSPTDTVFVVHGHDQIMKGEVLVLLHEAGLRPVVLAEQPNQGKTLIEKLLHNAGQAYALVLLSPDDVGGTKGTPAERLQARARQNVILELGLFVGLLGRSRVGVLYKPGVELPTDVIGLAYIQYENIESARHAIIKELKAAGLPLNLARLFGH
jgi:predicted nucleotide-binding protein